MSHREGQGDEGVTGLGWKDYLSLFVAALETVGLPLLVFMVVLFVVLVLARVIS